MSRTKTGLMLPLSAILLPLGACSGGSEGNEAAPGNETVGAEAPTDARLAALVARNGELERLNTLIGNSGMVDVLNGVGPYTLLAPTNGAFDALGSGRADALAGETMRPQAAALLRAHIVPGTLTRRDLEAAIASAGDRPVNMRTMAGDMLSFSRSGDGIVVAAEGGARARLTGQESLAANGAVQPIDGLLVPVNNAAGQR